MIAGQDVAEQPRHPYLGQWIPFDADAIGQFLGYPLVLEEGQECEYGQRRNRSDSFDEEAIAQLLCIPGQDFARTAAGR